MKTPIEQVREALENVRKAVNDHRPPECVPDFYIGGQLNKALAALKSMEGQPLTPRLTVDEAMEVVQEHCRVKLAGGTPSFFFHDLRARLTKAVKP